MSGPRSIPRRLVLVSERLAPIGEEERRIADQGDAEIRVAPLWDRAALRSAGQQADVIVLGAVEPVDAEVLRDMDRVVAIVRRGIGTDNVDLEEATRRGILVAVVPDASVDEVSDHALALLLAVERRVVHADRLVRADDAPGAAAAVAEARRLGQLTVGVVGLGRIGRAFARKAACLVAEVIAHDPFVDHAHTPPEVPLLPLDDLLERADVVSLHAPGSHDGEPLIGERALTRMKPGATLINTARGSLIDEAALLEALESGRLAGAGLDVTRHEPLPADSPLVGRHDVVLTGHTASKGRLAGPALRRGAADAAVAVLSGRSPAHLANPAVLDRPECRLALLGRSGQETRRSP